MDRAEKKEAVAELKGILKDSQSVVVAHYSGMTVAHMQNLRKRMRAAGASVQVAKNRLVKIALDGSGVADFGPLLKGPTLIAYSADPVAAPKVAVAAVAPHTVAHTQSPPSRPLSVRDERRTRSANHGYHRVTPRRPLLPKPMKPL